MKYFAIKESDLIFITKNTTRYTLESLKTKLSKAGFKYEAASQVWVVNKEERNNRFNKKIYGIIGLMAEYNVPYTKG